MRALALSVFTVFYLSSFAPPNVDWFGMLGKSIDDRDVYATVSEYGEYTSQYFTKSYETQLNWEKNGIAIALNDLSVVRKIYFFNDQYTVNSATFARFRGQLPLGIGLDMSPKRMKEVLGTPTKEEGTVYRKLTYVTNFQYDILFKKDVIQYVRIGLLDEKAKETN